MKMKNGATNALLIIVAIVAVLVLTGAIYAPVMPLYIFVWVVLGLGILVLVIDKVVNKKPSPILGKKPRFWQGLMAGAMGLVAVSLFFIVFEGVLTPIATATAWGLRHYNDHKPAGQPVAEMARSQQLGGAPVNLRLAVGKNDRVMFSWQIDCAKSKLPANCNGEPTYVQLCDYEWRFVGNQEGQFTAQKDCAVVTITKSPYLGDAHDPIAIHALEGQIWYDANSYQKWSSSSSSSR